MTFHDPLRGKMAAGQKIQKLRIWGKNYFLNPLIFSPAVFYLLPHNHRIIPGKIIWFFGSRKRTVGEKNEGVGENEKKEKMVFPILNFHHHYLQCVSYLYTPSRLVKNSPKRCKNSSFKVENFKIFAPTGAFLSVGERK